jgi:hypothetical protein
LVDGVVVFGGELFDGLDESVFVVVAADVGFG